METVTKTLIKIYLLLEVEQIMDAFIMTLQTAYYLKKPDVLPSKSLIIAVGA